MRVTRALHLPRERGRFSKFEKQVTLPAKGPRTSPLSPISPRGRTLPCQPSLLSPSFPPPSRRRHQLFFFNLFFDSVNLYPNPCLCLFSLTCCPNVFLTTFCLFTCLASLHFYFLRLFLFGTFGGNLDLFWTSTRCSVQRRRCCARSLCWPPSRGTQTSSDCASMLHRLCAQANFCDRCPWEGRQRLCLCTRVPLPVDDELLCSYRQLDVTHTPRSAPVSPLLALRYLVRWAAGFLGFESQAWLVLTLVGICIWRRHAQRSVLEVVSGTLIVGVCSRGAALWCIVGKAPFLVPDVVKGPNGKKS